MLSVSSRTTLPSAPPVVSLPLRLSFASKFCVSPNGDRILHQAAEVALSRSTQRAQIFVADVRRGRECVADTSG